jgi:hypothetical protein
MTLGFLKSNLRNKLRWRIMKKKLLINITALLYITNSFGFQLPENYNAKTEKFFNISNNNNGTYNFTFKKYPQFLYQTREQDLDAFALLHCNDDPNLLGASFAYISSKTKLHFYDNVFFNTKTNEVSYTYTDINSICSPQHEIMADADNQYAPHVIFFHPIFKSQPKTWIIVPRKFNEWAKFSNVDDSQPTFLENGNFRLVIEAEPETAQEMKPTKVETIPIDYSIFEKPVNKPTCYAMPENYKLRPCTFAEAKLRSPALKAFLGEA